MRKFMDEDVLLNTHTSKKLFHKVAEKCPVIEFHTHLSAKDIFEQRRYDNLSKIWLENDREKMEAMRRCGVDEFYITGIAPDYDKFLKFAEIIPKLIGSQIYLCTHLELRRCFGIDLPLSGKTAPEIWHKTGEKLAKKGYDIVSLLDRLNVKVLCTVDDPADDLEWHLRCEHSGNVPFKVLPSFCPDRFINIDQPVWFNGITELGNRYGTVHDWDSLKAGLSKALDFFCDSGCKVVLSDPFDQDHPEGDPDCIIEKVIHHGELTDIEIAGFKGKLQDFLKAEYSRRGLKEIPAGAISDVSEQIDSLMKKGMLGGSVGLMTDSHSFSSVVQHEHFRRVICDKIGQLVESGLYLDDMDMLGELVQDICWRNAVEYFGFDL